MTAALVLVPAMGVNGAAAAWVVGCSIVAAWGVLNALRRRRRETPLTGSGLDLEVAPVVVPD
jgi:predicted outer membrane lipoprotein